MCQHITLILPNRPGEFYKAAKLLGENKVNIIGYHLTSEGIHGLLQLLCVPHDQAFSILKAKYKGYCSKREIIIVRIPNTPGQLYRVLFILQEKCLNLPNSYQFSTSGGNAFAVLELNGEEDTKKAKDLLTGAELKLINDISEYDT